MKSAVSLTEFLFVSLFFLSATQTVERHLEQVTENSDSSRLVASRPHQSRHLGEITFKI